jgi:hypothetical protein
VKILNRLPYFKVSTTVTVRGATVRIKPYQIIVWVSISPVDLEWDPRTPVFPAILDTGNNHNFFSPCPPSSGITSAP